jgi:hypothetical protein
MAPQVAATVPKRTRKVRLVAKALQDSRWVRDITGSLSISAFRQYIALWCRIQQVQLRSIRLCLTGSFGNGPLTSSIPRRLLTGCSFSLASSDGAIMSH